MITFYVFVCVSLLGLVAYGLQIWAVRLTTKKPLPQFSLETLPPISILKPLKGLDDNLFDNLQSFCIQDYPDYEIIFSLQSYNDPAYKVARNIKNRYPDKKISLVVEECSAGLNPKVNNLIGSYKASQYDYILVSDSNVLVDEGYLKEIIRHMADPGVGLVSNLIKGVGGYTIGAVFENLHLNSFIMGSVCFLDRFLKMPCVIGKSMLVKKSDFEAIGGFKAVKDVLAEDYVIGQSMHKNGKKVVLSNYTIQNVNEYWGIRKFLNRHTRWGKLRWKIGGPKYLFELFGNPVFMSAFPIFFWEASKITVSFALLVSLIKIMGDFYLGRKTGSELRTPFLYMLAPLKDFLIGIIWFVPLVSSTVAWRGNRYVICKDSVLLPCAENGLWALRYRIVDAIKGRFA